MSNQNKAKPIITYLLLYGLCIVGFTVYYSEYFTDFTRYKGDEYIYYFGFIIPITYLLFFLIHFALAKINIANTLFAPILLLFLGIAIGLMVVLSLPIEGTTKEAFYVHSSIHIVLTYFFVRFLWRKHFSSFPVRN